MTREEVVARRKRFNARQNQLYKKVRDEVFALYSNGDMKCARCYAPAEHLHHTDPKGRKYEDKHFQQDIDKKRYQTKQYKKNKNYVVPLCGKCHIAIHKELKEKLKCVH
jgi:hypothetical protein